jgi:hypothetical protein
MYQAFAVSSNFSSWLSRFPKRFFLARIFKRVPNGCIMSLKVEKIRQPQQRRFAYRSYARINNEYDPVPGVYFAAPEEPVIRETHRIFEGPRNE